MKNLVKLSFTLLMAALMFTGCNCFKKMAKDLDSVEVKCTPEVLVLNNGKVAASVAVSFPDGYFDEDAVVKITPVLLYDGGEAAATPYYYQGTKVEDNYKVVTTGATEDIEFAYTSEMRKSTLQLRVEVKCKDEFTVINLNTGAELKSNESAADGGYNLALGINTLQQDFRPIDLMTKMASGYQRVTNTIEESNVMYAINSSAVSSKALKSECVAAFKALIEENSKNDRATQKLSAQGYASPDGPEKLNDKLSKARSESAKAAMAKFAKEYGLTIDASSYGEDWDGFKALVEASNIQDKNLILQVLSLYDSSVKREEEIKNLSAVFSALETEVLPQLRRTKMVNDVELVGKSDEEIMACFENRNERRDELTLLEILHITDSKSMRNAKHQVGQLEYAAKKFNDGVAYNNLGVTYARLKRYEDAVGAFKKAAELGVDPAVTNKNLTLTYLAMYNVEAAGKHAGKVDKKTKSLYQAYTGNYTPASKQLGGYNKAIALTMLNQYDAAEKAIGKDKSAEAMYLRAVIASLKGDTKTAETQLKEAIKKNGQMANKAVSDVNLNNLFESGFTL